MMNSSIKITEQFLSDEDGSRHTVFGIVIESGEVELSFPDLSFDRDKLESFCNLLGDDIPSERILLELFEDFLF